MYIEWELSIGSTVMRGYEQELMNGYVCVDKVFID
jgi:hypothetical protein